LTILKEAVEIGKKKVSDLQKNRDTLQLPEEISLTVLEGVIKYWEKETVENCLTEFRNELQNAQNSLSKRIIQCVEMPALTNDSMPAVY
jgi:hypothetical protein